MSEFEVPARLEYVATLSWALSGALVGARRGYDLIGVLGVAFASSVGGGLLRDVVFLQRRPAFVEKGTYLVLIVAATVILAIGFRYSRPLPRWIAPEKLTELIDALGTPAYAVVGMQMALADGFSLPAVVLVGVVNGVGGGLLRDVLTREEPRLFLPGQYSGLVVVIACLAFVALTQWGGVALHPAALWTIAGFFVIRALTIRFNWQTRAILAEADRLQSAPPGSSAEAASAPNRDGTT